MKTVKSIIFRYLTNTDFFNIYKPAGTEPGGGGQTYIDIPQGSVRIENWVQFFSIASNVHYDSSEGIWEAPINSIGLEGRQTVQFHQRRIATVSITSQTLGRGSSNRINAWHPENGFPAPLDPTSRHQRPENLAVFLAATLEGETWAGWFQNWNPTRDPFARTILGHMLAAPTRQGHAGFISLPEISLFLEENDARTPFWGVEESNKFFSSRRSEEETVVNLFDEDLGEGTPRFREITAQVRRRNANAVKTLKTLYEGRCQITGEELTFRKRDGTWYSEAHHLIPLGERGADSPHNIIIVSPLIHRMLHYATISKVDLGKISKDNTLEITINGRPHTISWHPKHAEAVRKHQVD